MSMKNVTALTLLAAALIAAVAVSIYAGYFDSVRNGSRPPQGDEQSQATSSPPQQTPQAPIVPPQGTAVSIEGTMVCLPHKGTSGPQTMECAFGLKADDGRYYALSDTDPQYRNVSGVPMNVRVKVEGTFIARTDSKYQDIGIIYVTAVTRL